MAGGGDSGAVIRTHGMARRARVVDCGNGGEGGCCGAAFAGEGGTPDKERLEEELCEEEERDGNEEELEEEELDDEVEEGAR